MGSPLTFWKLQQVPVLWLLDHLGHREWIDDPIGHQRELLPVVRLGSLWIWLVAIALTAAWSRQSHGPRAMALAAWLFALSPNLIAHGTLATMELPLVAATTAMFWSFWRFLDSRRWPWFWAERSSRPAWRSPASSRRSSFRRSSPCLVGGAMARRRRGAPMPLTWHVSSRMLGFVVVMLLANLARHRVCAFPSVPRRDSTRASRDGWARRRPAKLRRLYETPLPQDWVGFATQMHHQASGGASYLWGERRMKGWWYYYFVALAVKVPLGFWLLVVARSALQLQVARSASERFPLPDKIAYPPAPAGVPALPGDHGGRLVAELRRALPAPAGTAGDRLGLGPGRVPASRSGRGSRPPSASPACRGRWRQAIPTS